MEANEKVFIVGAPNIDKMKLAIRLTQMDERLSLPYMFTSDISQQHLTKQNTETYTYYNDNDNINLDYKNNALLYIHADDYVSEGVTLDEFYEHNVIPVDIDNFNGISEKILNSVEPIIVWIDTKAHGDLHIVKETKFLMERLAKRKCLYFLNENTTPEHICATVLSYLNARVEVRRQIIKECS